MEKRSRSVRVAHDSLDIQREVLVRHTIHLQIADVRRRGRQKPRVIDSGSSAKSSSVVLWNNSILPGRSIYIRQSLLRFESSCRVILSLRHDIARTPDRDTYLPAFGWNIEFLFFGSVS
jgi:hypothetical protein